METQISIVGTGFDEKGNMAYKEEGLAYVIDPPPFVLEMTIKTWPIVEYNNVRLGLTKLPGIIIHEVDGDKLKWGLEITGEFRHLCIENLLQGHPLWGKKEIFSPKRSSEDLYKALRDGMAIELRDLRTAPKDYLDTRDMQIIYDLEEKTRNYLEILGVITGRRNDVTIIDLRNILAGKYLPDKGDSPQQKRVVLKFTAEDLKGLDSLKNR